MSQEGPTIGRRLQPGFIVISTDEAMVGDLRAVAGEDWQVEPVASIDDIGDWGKILLYRFILMDLDSGPEDPGEEVRRIRQEYMVNTPVLCFGGDQDLRDRVRPEGADRFFDREELKQRLPEFMEAMGWGGGQ